MNIEYKNITDKQRVDLAIQYIEIAFRDSEENKEEPITRKDLEYVYEILTKKD